MRGNRKDANHKEIVDHFRSLGFYVHDISDLKNCCDLIITKGRSAYVEIKDGAKPKSARQLTAGELKFKQDIEMKGGLWFLAEEIQDVNNIYMQFNSYE